MKLTSGTLRLCMELAERIGTVIDAHMYGNSFISVDGESNDGKEFSIALRIKEEEKNAEELE